mgnify:CR=1 FL=1
MHHLNGAAHEDRGRRPHGWQRKKEVMVEASTTAASSQRQDAAAQTRGRRSRGFLHRYGTSLYIALLFLLLAGAVLAPNIVISIPSGHVGVLWLRFFGGTVTEHAFGEGTRLIFPWDQMVIYDARLRSATRTYDTLSSNGLSMQVEVAVRYRINVDNVGVLHKLVGPDYFEVLIYPELGAQVRELISTFTPEQLYTEARADIQSTLRQRLVDNLGASLGSAVLRDQLVSVEDVLIRSIQLPDRIVQAIERKTEQYQVMKEYDFRIAREEKERERKRIEAEGIRTFQDIVARTITPEYLRLRGIEATTSLSTSANSKIIIIGGRDGLPVILNTESAAPSSPVGLAPSPPPLATRAAEVPSVNVPPANAPSPPGTGR